MPPNQRTIYDFHEHRFLEKPSSQKEKLSPYLGLAATRTQRKSFTILSEGLLVWQKAQERTNKTNQPLRPKIEHYPKINQLFLVESYRNHWNPLTQTKHPNQKTPKNTTYPTPTTPRVVRRSVPCSARPALWLSPRSLGRRGANDRPRGPAELLGNPPRWEESMDFLP